MESTFVTAGKAIFTVSNPEGERYTYRVSKKENDNAPPVFFVSLLTGPENEEDYTYIGVLCVQDGSVRLTRASRFTEEATAVAVVRWALRKVWRRLAFPQGYQIRHCGRCGRCGRLLTVPESIDSGIGPECARKMGI